ncbi:unnamed protein product [Paramecium sonneborni]|uniref:HSF-type DNA-binding domain-containing protein n=1 Tax=Paramecium sonneborni TaxID=65129 RepID=A0A8S1QZT5_9CILI|nr:unnamed protein product [Paramecium sonneborni]
MENGHSIPIFLTKLYTIVQGNQEQEILRFDESGRIVVIVDQERLQQYLLPEYFGHKNLPNNQICMDLRKDTIMVCQNLNINILEEMGRQFLNQIKRRNEIQIVEQIPDQEDINTQIEQIRQTQQSLQSLIQDAATQNLMIMNIIMHQQQQMAETSTANFVRFSHLSDLIQQVVSYFQINTGNEIESTLAHQRKEAQKGLEYIIEDTEK